MRGTAMRGERGPSVLPCSMGRRLRFGERRQEGRRTAAAFVCRYIHRLCFHDQMSFGGGPRARLREWGPPQKLSIRFALRTHTCHGTNTMSYRARRSVVSVVSMFVIRLHRHLLRITFAMAFLPSGLSVSFHLLYQISVDGLGQREGFPFPCFVLPPLSFSLQRSVSWSDAGGPIPDA